MIQRFLSFIKQSAYLSTSPDLAARSWCVGVFVAWSPFLGIQTPLALLLSYCLQLNMRITLVASFIVNNIWTVVPISFLNYAFGKLVFDILNVQPSPNPTFLQPFEHFLESRIGIHAPNLWTFFVGGTLLALIISVAAYPFFKRIFTHFSQH